MSDKVVFFVHIPKAAGRTLIEIIKNEYNNDELFSNSKAVKNNLSDDWKNVDVLERWRISKNAFIDLSEEKKNKLRFVFGHMFFGWHNYLDRDHTYVTILRDPVERAISHYYYILELEHHHLKDIIISENLSIGDFVRAGLTFTTSNCQTKMLSGVIETDDDLNNKKLLDLAKYNLREYFSIVGLQERFEETLSLFKNKFGWEAANYEKKNVTRNKPDRTNIGKEDIDIIKKYNKLDIELYEYAEELFLRKDV